MLLGSLTRIIDIVKTPLKAYQPDSSPSPTSSRLSHVQRKEDGNIRFEIVSWLYMVLYMLKMHDHDVVAWTPEHKHLT